MKEKTKVKVMELIYACLGIWMRYSDWKLEGVSTKYGY